MSMWNGWFMWRRDALSESEMNGTRCGRYIWDQDECWCIQLINSLDQTCHWGFVGVKTTSTWTVALHVSYMYVHRCILLKQAANLSCLFYPSVPFLPRLVNPSALTLLYLLNHLFLQSLCVPLFIKLPQLHRMPICSHFSSPSTSTTTSTPPQPSLTVCYALWCRIHVWYLMAEWILVRAR